MDNVENGKLKLPEISFDMPITDLIIELEKLRYNVLSETTHPLVFAQIKSIFHIMESVGSLRIEGNNTTIADYVETTKVEAFNTSSFSEEIREIANVEEATKYIEEYIEQTPISLQFIKEIHAIVVNKLSTQHEGSHRPGSWRQEEVRISGSSHIPPHFMSIEPLMKELVDFINEECSPKYDLLKICVAHHRFVWIHPFENGNGRTVRLLTYALLLKKVFKDKRRIINPTAVFCSNRKKYYEYLSKADNGSNDGMIDWAEYVLSGLKNEIKKIDKLSDYQYLKGKILQPSLQDALSQRFITEEEYKILQVAILTKNQEISVKNIMPILADKSSASISRRIKSLVDRKLLLPVADGARKYVLSFSNNYILRSVLKMLDKEEFLPLNK